MLDDAGQLNRPLLIYDGDCDLCQRSVQRWRTITGGTVDYAPSQEVASRFPQVPREQFDRSVVLVEPDGRVTTGAAAVFRSLAHVPGRGWAWWMYRRIPGFAPVAEAVYRFTAKHRRSCRR